MHKRILILLSAFILSAQYASAQAIFSQQIAEGMNSLGAKQNRQKALTIANSALRKNAHDCQALFLKAEYLRNTGNFAEAEKVYLEAIKQAKRQNLSSRLLAFFYEYLGHNVLQMSRFTDCKRYAKQALTYYPQEDGAYILLVQSLAAEDRNAEALSTIEKARKELRDGFHLLGLRITCLRRLKHFSEAMEYCQYALRIFPNSKDFQVQKLLTIMAMGEFSNAEKMLSEYPNCESKGDLYYELALAYLRANQYDCETKALANAFKYAQRDHFYRQRAEDLGRVGKHDEAIKAFTKALELRSHQAPYFYELRAEEERHAGMYKEAVADYLLTDKISRTWSEKRCRHLAECYSRLGKYKEAIACHNQLMQKEPSVETLNRRAKTYFDAGQYSSCLADIDEVTKKKPNEALQLKSLCLLAMGKNTQALNIANTLLAKYPNLPDYYALRAKILLKMNRKDEAKKDLLKQQEKLKEAR